MSTPVTFSWMVGPAASTSGPSATDTDRLFGKDIWFDLGATDGANLVVDKRGDWLLVTGREALRQSLIRRFLTSPGEWATKPDYGAGVRAAVKSKNTRSNRDRLATAIRTQALKDHRVAKVDDVQVIVSEGKLRLSVKIIPKGETKRSRPLTVTVEAS